MNRFQINKKIFYLWLFLLVTAFALIIVCIAFANSKSEHLKEMKNYFAIAGCVLFVFCIISSFSDLVKNNWYFLRNNVVARKIILLYPILNEEPSLILYTENVIIERNQTITKVVTEPIAEPIEDAIYFNEDDFNIEAKIVGELPALGILINDSLLTKEENEV